MTKRAEKVDQPLQVPAAKPRREPIDVDAGFDRAMARFPKIISRLAQ